jgi:pyruvate/2-oxoglutarate dehydrogenase complex dihydrolipoamide dehydrogenase (E3) component
VEVRTGAYIEAEDIRAERPDALIVATGGLPRMDGVQAAAPAEPIRGADLEHVVSSTDLLTGSTGPLGKTALVLDDVGGYEAVGAAEYLIGKGVAVTFATRCASFAPIVDTWTRAEPALHRLHAGDFRLLTRTLLLEVRRGECSVRPLQGTRAETVAADMVVLVMPRDPLTGLYTELKDSIPHVSIVGDAKSPRDMQAAVREGHLAARSIN